jgi:hypothetical protein
MIGLGWNDERAVEGIEVPWWLGLADTDYARRRYLFLPVPYNVVYRLGVRVWLWIKFAKGRPNPMPPHDCYWKGYSEGYSAGHQAARSSDERIVAILKGER